jgi:hypothetical protein
MNQYNQFSRLEGIFRSSLRIKFSRSINSRPGQPIDLNRYDKGPRSIQVPPHFSNAEAEKMGKLKPLPEGSSLLGRRSVPKSNEDFEKERLKFKKAVSTARRSFAKEWTERSAREEEAAATFRAAVIARKAASDAGRAAKRALSARTQATIQAQAGSNRIEKRADSVAVEDARLEKARILRNEWLDKLEEESVKRWVPENKIDEMISPQFFELKFSWQFQSWFEAKERKRRLREEARRSRRPGQPLRKVNFDAESGLAEFASDWESENEDDVGVGSAAHAAREAERAALGGGGASIDAAQAEALSVARAAARERGQFFPEPSYDADGRPLPLPSSTIISPDVNSVGLAELFHGKSAETIMKDYETFMIKHASSVGLEISASSSSSDVKNEANSSNSSQDAKAMHEIASPTASENDTVKSTSLNSVLGIVDNGERAAENAYIDMCVAAGNAEALFYALLRKRARLVRAIEDRGFSSYKPALTTFSKVWGEWINEVGVQAGGVFDARRSGDRYSHAMAKAMQNGETLQMTLTQNAVDELKAAAAAAAQEAEAAAAAAISARSVSAQATEQDIDPRNVAAGERVQSAAVPKAASFFDSSEASPRRGRRSKF